MLMLRRFALLTFCSLANEDLQCGELKFTAIAAVKFRIYAAGWIRF